MEYLSPGYIYKASGIHNDTGSGVNHFSLHKMGGMTAKATPNLPNDTQAPQRFKGPQKPLMVLPLGE